MSNFQQVLLTSHTTVPFWLLPINLINKQQFDSLIKTYEPQTKVSLSVCHNTVQYISDFLRVCKQQTYLNLK